MTIESVQKLTSPKLLSLPQPKTPEQFCSLYSFACRSRHFEEEKNIPFENPILNILKTGVYPPDKLIRVTTPRPFLLLEGKTSKKCTLQEMEQYWRIEHQSDLLTPVSIVQLTILNPFGQSTYSFGKPLSAKQYQNSTAILFNNLEYNLEVGKLYFVHNFEIAEPVPSDFSL